MKFGYARVSTGEQNLDRQIDIILNQGVHRANIFTEKLTGKNMKRPALNELLEKVDAGDQVIVSELTRLSRSTKDLINISEELKKKNIELVSLKENIDTKTATGKMLFGMLSVLAQFESDLISERTKEGLRASRSRGFVGGRRPIEREIVDRAIMLYESKTLGVGEICSLVGISKPTLYKYYREYSKKKIRNIKNYT